MKILRKYRGGDLTGPNSPYRTERIAYWTWYFLRHPISMTFGRPVQITLTTDAWAAVLPVYGNFKVPASSGVQFQGAEIEGDAASLRRLAWLLLDRAEQVDAVQKLLDAGTWPSHEDSTNFPAGFGDDVGYQDLRLGNAPMAGQEAGAS